MKVTQLIQDIGKCRDLIATGDEKLVLAKINLFEKVYTGVKINLDRIVKNPKYELDFTFYDLKELSDEIYEFLQDYPQKFVTDAHVNRINELGYIDNKILRNLMQECCDVMYIDTKLRECYKILAYGASVLYLMELNEA